MLDGTQYVAENPCGTAGGADIQPQAAAIAGPHIGADRRQPLPATIRAKTTYHFDFV